MGLGRAQLCCRVRSRRRIDVVVCLRMPRCAPRLFLSIVVGAIVSQAMVSRFWGPPRAQSGNSPSLSPRLQPLLSCSLYSGTSATRDPCCHGLIYLYNFGPSYGDAAAATCDGEGREGRSRTLSFGCLGPSSFRPQTASISSTSPPASRSPSSACRTRRCT